VGLGLGKGSRLRGGRLGWRLGGRGEGWWTRRAGRFGGRGNGREEVGCAIEREEGRDGGRKLIYPYTIYI